MFEFFLDCHAVCDGSQGRDEGIVHDWIASARCASQGRAKMQRLFPKQGSQRDKKLFSNTIFVRVERDILLPLPDDLSCA